MAHERFDHLEADFTRYYHADLGEALQDPRRALVLIRMLPPESMFVRSFLGGHVWGYDQELAATAVELMQALVYTTALGFGAKKSRMPKLRPVPRPSIEPGAQVARPRRRATVKETIDIIGSMMGQGR